jgi:hypothetical protein
MRGIVAAKFVVERTTPEIPDGLRPRVWLRLRTAAGGNWTPDTPEPEIAMDGHSRPN